jgi:hypothetical protein
MPTFDLGYSRNELASIIKGMIGNQSAKLETYIYQGITAWQYEFYGLHDWTFAHSPAMCGPEPTLDTIVGQRCYPINDIGSPTILTNNIEIITCITPNSARVLQKGTLSSLRMTDPQGISRGKPTIWIPLTLTEIELYPIPNISETFVIEGKAEPSFISGIGPATQFPTDYPLNVPYKYQDCFLQFCFVKALRQERDPRLKEELLIFKDQLRGCIAEDMRQLESNLRMQTTNEHFGSNVPYDINARLWYTGDDEW